MLRISLPFPLLALALTLTSPPAGAASSLYTDLYGKQCKLVASDKGSGSTTRQCKGVGGYSLLVHETNARSSVDIVTPGQQIYPLEYWEVVAPGPSYVGRKAEWRVERAGKRLVPTGLLVRLNAADPATQGPRHAPGALITAARIAHDGACVVYQSNAAPRQADARARAAAANPKLKCLGVFSSQ